MLKPSLSLSLNLMPVIIDRAYLKDAFGRQKHSVQEALATVN